MSHFPVLYHEIIQALTPQTDGLYIDGTIGAGGHAWGILSASSPNGRLLGLDLDPEAIKLSKIRLQPFGDRFIIKRASYITLQNQVKSIGWTEVNGILLDLGVSSMQLDSVGRGFSFRTEDSLDMRFDPNGVVTASDLLNNLPEKELADIIYKYGEERKSRQIAREIVKQRPIRSTQHLVGIIVKVVKSKPEKIHPATRTFQALRIATNDELESLGLVLPQAVSSLMSGGRLAVISFHSLEDRIVKQYFHRESKDCICPPEYPVCTCNHHASIRVITKHPIRPVEEEIQSNPRSRSSRLRIVEKL